MWTATAHEWAMGYLRQAEADIRAAGILQGEEPSVTAMLLQMALEKLGKAALLRSGQITIERARSSHAAASSMVQQLARNPRAYRRLGYKPDVVRWTLAPLVDSLERCHPTRTPGGPHLEYPWQASSGEIQWPAKHLEVVKAFRPTSTSVSRLYAFVETLSNRFDQVFP